LSRSFQEGTYIPSRSERVDTELLNTLEEDLCKECTRPTLDEVLKDIHLKASQAQGVCTGENLFQVPKLKRLSAECAGRAPEVRLISLTNLKRDKKKSRDPTVRLAGG
jgi:hypothetical protein